MTYLSIDRDRIKISLSREEVLRLFGSGFSSIKSEPKAGYVLKSLLKKAVRDMGYRPKSVDIIARAVQNRGGGIDVYFTGCKRERAQNSDGFVLEFPKIELLSDAAEAIMFSLPELSENGKLYLFEGKYRLLLPCLCAPFELSSLAREFCGKLFTDNCQKAVTEEHGRLILPDKAVRLVAKL